YPIRQARPDLPRRSRPPRHHPVAQPPALETCPSAALGTAGDGCAASVHGAPVRHGDGDPRQGARRCRAAVRAHARSRLPVTAHAPPARADDDDRPAALTQRLTTLGSSGCGADQAGSTPFPDGETRTFTAVSLRWMRVSNPLSIRSSRAMRPVMKRARSILPLSTSSITAGWLLTYPIDPRRSISFITSLCMSKSERWPQIEMFSSTPV